MAIDDTLNERGERYGDFIENAKLSQTLKTILQSTPKWNELRADQAEALEVIMQKISRILTGDPKYRDNWHDIVGYAKLVDDRMARHERIAELATLKRTEAPAAALMSGACEYCGVSEGERHLSDCAALDAVAPAPPPGKVCAYCGAAYPGAHDPECIVVIAKEQGGNITTSDY